MANYCSTNYVVEGDIEILKRLQTAINEGYKANRDAKKSTLCMQDVFEKLGYDNPDALPEGIGLDGEWMQAEIENVDGTEVLKFQEEYKWDCSCNMEILAEEVEPFAGKITGVYRRSEEPGCGIYEVNDLQGKYFPEKYSVWYDGGDSGCYEGICMDERDVVDAVRTIRPEIPENATIQDIKEFAEGKDDGCSINAYQGV